MSQWYYSDSMNRRQGPVDAEALAGLHRDGTVTTDTLVWRDGLGNWQPLHTVIGEIIPAAAPAAADPSDPVGAPPVQTLADGANPYEVAAPASPYAPPTSRLADHGEFQAGGEVVYAGFWKRAAAYLIDSLVIGAVTWVVQLVVMGVFFGVSAGAMAGDSSSLLAGGLAGLVVGLFIVPMVLQAIYFASFHASSWQATLGKMAIGIKVVDEDGQRISFMRGIGRFFGMILSGLILYIGFFMAGFTERKRALHDMVAGTLVVDRWAYTARPELQRRELGTVATVVLVIGGLLVVGYVALMFMIGFMAAMSGGS